MSRRQPLEPAGVPADPIPPDVRSRLRNLRLTSRRAAGFQGVGVHHSRNRGAGLEFTQYRAYEPGDELRQIDWKLYARSDRFFVREAERESPLALWIMIDASASMTQTDAARPGWSRFDAAKTIAACLATLALHQGDRFGWVILHDAGLRLAVPATGLRQRDRLMFDLQTLTASGAFPSTTQLTPLWSRIGATDMVIMLSDLFDDDGVALIERLTAAGRETLAIQILTADERDFPFQGGHRFRDPETGEELLGDGTVMRDDFLQRFGNARDILDARLDASGIRHAAYILDQPIDLPLQRLFGTPAAAEYS